jgi:hypothetical protein
VEEERLLGSLLGPFTFSDPLLPPALLLPSRSFASSTRTTRSATLSTSPAPATFPTSASTRSTSTLDRASRTPRGAFRSTSQTPRRCRWVEGRKEGKITGIREGGGGRGGRGGDYSRPKTMQSSAGSEGAALGGRQFELEGWRVEEWPVHSSSTTCPSCPTRSPAQ